MEKPTPPPSQIIHEGPDFNPVTVILAIIGILAMIFAGSCTNRQLHDRWEARGIKRGWLDTVHAPVGVIVPDSNTDARIDAVIDSLIKAGFKGDIAGVVPIYLPGKDTCLNKSSVEYLIKWRTKPAIVDSIYSSFNHEDDNLLLYLEYDKKGKPHLRYKIKTPTHIVPPHTPTAWEQIKGFFIGLGKWLMWLIIALCIIAGLAIWSYIRK